MGIRQGHYVSTNSYWKACISDIFDHEGDAIDDILFGRTADEGVSPRFTTLRHSAVGPKTCKFCGQRGLHWAKYNGQWRLAAGGNMHTCVEYTPDVLDFDQFFNATQLRTSGT